ncbi:MAG: hypothetical protein ACYDCN_04210, partial [Bacteroidia bacterium]
DEDVAKTDLLHNIDKLANQTDTVEEQASVDAADANVGHGIITAIGFKVAGKGGTSHPHTFKQRKSAKKTVLVELPSFGKGTIYSVRCKVVLTEVTPAVWGPTKSSSKSELLISGGGLTTGQLLAVQFGVDTSTGTGTGTTTTGAATQRAVRGTRKIIIPTYTYDSDPIAWQPHVLFAVVQ